MSKPKTIAEYIAALSPERKIAINQLIACIRENIPAGFEECLNYGMPSWVVPHTLYEPGYHVDPKLPLPFLSVASQKSHVAVYHMGIYADDVLLHWFRENYSKHSKTKLNMGKSCIRFKKIETIPYELIGSLCAKMSPKAWVDIYESQIK